MGFRGKSTSTFSAFFAFCVLAAMCSCTFQPIIHGSSENSEDSPTSTLAPTPTPVPAGRLDYNMPAATESWISSADFNRDGILDLILTYRSQDQVVVHRGSLGGEFSATPTQTLSTTAATQVVHVITGQFNEDNWPDAAVVYWSSAKMTVFYNDGTGTLQAGTDYAGPTNTITLASADIDKDGFQDIVTANTATNGVTIYWGDSGAANFTSTSFASVGGAGTNPLRVLIADINEDTNPDILTGNLNGDSISYVRNTGLRTFAAFTNPLTFAANSDPSDMEIADINHDNHLDLVVSLRALGQVSVHQGVGDGTFGAGTTYATSATPNALKFVDFNGDGDLDLLNLCSSASPGLQIWLGNGDMTFVTPRNGVPTLGFSMQMTVGDFNGTSKPDIAITPSSGTSSFSVLYDYIDIM